VFYAEIDEGNRKLIMHRFIFIAIIFLAVPQILFPRETGYAVNTSLDFLKNMSEHNFEANRKYMAPLYANDAFAEKLTNSWNYQVERLGPYQNLVSTKYDYFRDYEIVYLTCQFEKSEYTIKLVFNNKQEITDVYFIPYPPLIAAGDLNSLWLVMFFILWELAWKAMGLWKAGRNQKVGWFITIFILPTFGLLPIIYTLFVKDK
jgi:hypothetical protein